ncbi:MAG: PAS domain-containing protein [Clostridia bacterium]|nr:PAS domain-containing protein [Clostridia bacterium]
MNIPFDPSVFNKILDESPFGFLLIDDNGLILHAGKEACRLTGLREEELAGKNYSEFWGEFPKDESDAIIAGFSSSNGPEVYHRIIFRRLDADLISLYVEDATESFLRLRFFEDELKRFESAQTFEALGSYEIDYSTGIFHGSREAFRILGIPYAKAGIDSGIFSEMLADADACKGFDESDSNDKHARSRILHIPSPLGTTTRSIRDRYHIIRDSDGKPVKTVGFIKELHASDIMDLMFDFGNDHFWWYLNFIDTLILMLDKEGDVVFINDSGCRLLGYDKGQIIGKNWVLNFIPDNERSTIENVLDTVRALGEYDIHHFTNSILTADGSHKIINWKNTILRNQGGAFIGSLSSGEDITIIKNNEAILVESEKRLKWAEEIASVGSWVRDLDTGEYECSDGFLSICGLDRSTFIPTYETMKSVTHPDDVEMMDSIVRDSIKTGCDFDFENRIVRPDGAVRHIRSRGTFIKDALGRPSKIIGTLLDITLYKEKENELLYSQRFLHQAEKTANVGSWMRNIITGEYTCSSGFYDVCGLDPGIFVPTHETMATTVHPADSEFVESLLSEKRSRGENFDIEHRIIRGDGITRHVRARGTYIRDSKGVPVEEIGTIADITKYKEEEARLKDAELIAIIGHWEWDIPTDRHIVSPGLLNIIGYKSLSEIPNGENINSLFHPEDRAKVHRLVIRARENGEPYSYEARIIRPDGQTRHVRVNGFPVVDNNGRTVKTKGTFADITQIKEYQEKILQNEIRFNKAEEAAGIGHWERNLETGLYVFSNGIYKILGIDPESPFSTFSDQVSLVHPDDAGYVRETIGRALKKDTGYVLEHRIVRPSGEIRHIKANVTIIRDASGVSRKLSGLVMDVTDLKKQEKERQAMEAHLRTSQKLESIGTLAGGVAHEINNPINGIMNYSQLILDSDNNLDEIKTYAAEILHETERVSSIVSNLLSFSRRDQTAFGSFNATDIIGQTLSLINTIFKKDNILIQTHCPQDLPRIRCSSQQIQQVIMNLLTNSRDSLNEKYPGSDRDKVISINCKRILKDANAFIQICIEDHGMGINPDVQQNIFDPFFTTKGRHEGTGLGLSISYGIVKEHNGALYFESEEGLYTRFYIELPASSD